MCAQRPGLEHRTHIRHRAPGWRLTWLCDSQSLRPPADGVPWLDTSRLLFKKASHTIAMRGYALQDLYRNIAAHTAPPPKLRCRPLDRLQIMPYCRWATDRPLGSRLSHSGEVDASSYSCRACTGASGVSFSFCRNYGAHR